MTAVATTSSQAVDNVAIVMGAGAMPVNQDDLLSDLLSGLALVEPVKPVLSQMEQDMLDVLDVDLETPVVAAVQNADVQEVAAPVTLAEAVKETTKPARKTATRKAAETAPVKAAAQKKKAAPKEPTIAPEDVQEVKAVTVAADVQQVSEAPVEPVKPAPQPRMTFAKKSEKIAHKLGDKARDYLVLDIKDADLTDEQLAAQQAEILARVDELAVKVGEKAVMLFGFLRNGGKLNEIMRRTFTVLLRDGHLTSGAKGNLVTNFEQKPYSMGTALSQANQMFSLFPMLKICTGKAVGGRMEMNPDSTILQKMKEELGL